MAKKKLQKNLKGSIVYVGSTKYRCLERLPEGMKHEIITGSSKLNEAPVLDALSEKFTGLKFAITKGCLAVPVKEYNLREKEDLFFADTINAIVSDLLRIAKKKEKEGAILTKADVRAHFARAQETAKRSMGTTETVILLSGLPKAKLEAIAGENNDFLNKIGNKCGGIEIFLDERETGSAQSSSFILTAKEEQLAAATKQDPGARLRLLLVMSVLDGLARSWDGKEPISWAQIDAAIKKAYSAQNVAMDGSFRVTPKGKAVTLTSLFESEVQQSPYVDDIQKETCDQDPDFVPRTIISFKGEGQEVRAKMENKESGFYAALKAQYKGLQITRDKKKIVLLGSDGMMAEAAGKILDFSNFCQALSDFKKLNPNALKIISQGILEGLSETEIKERMTVLKGVKSGVTKSMVEGEVDIKQTYRVNFYAKYSENQQTFFDLMVKGDKPVVICLGPAGTGKTSIAMQAALSVIQTYFKGEDNDAPSKLILCRKPSREGQKLGAVPGGMDEKMRLDYASFFDGLDSILAPCDANGRCDETMGSLVRQMLMAQGVIQIVPPEFLLGRTFPNAFVVADEVETFPTYQMRQMVTRPGKGTRLIILGDLDQDNGSLQVTQDPKWYKTPTDFELKDGDGFLKAGNGTTYSLGAKKNIGKFRYNATQITAFRPANGLSYYALLNSQSPVVSFCAMEEGDIYRSEAAAWGVFIERQAVIPENEEDEPVSAKSSGFDAKAMKAAFENNRRPKRPEENFGTKIIPLQGKRAG